MKHFIIILLLTWSGVISAQKETYNWNFGSHAAISFSTGAPVSHNNSALSHSIQEGCASISDKSGNLLFYTDGSKVWDSTNNVMPNGSGLAGNYNSAQAGVIVPMPLNDSLYYVFTVKNWSSPGYGFNYSIVNMKSQGNGLVDPAGDVIVKNTQINTDVREQVTAIYHKNCIDVWIITHEWITDEYVAYLLTDTGLQMTPVSSNVGMLYAGTNRFGYLKNSNDGKKICSNLGIVGSFQGTTVEILDFDNLTGTLSNPIVIADGGALNNAYSSEFSPNDSLLYVVGYNGNYIYQYDLSSGNQSQIQSSKTNIATGTSTKSCLQIGPDKKIYVSLNNEKYLGVINDPNSKANPNYVDQAVNLGAGIAKKGLPTFLKDIYIENTFDDEICSGDTISIYASWADTNYNYLWQDNSIDVSYMVTSGGTYWVEGQNHHCINVDTFNIWEQHLPNINAGEDTCICIGDSVELGDSLNITCPGWSYAWLPLFTPVPNPVVSPTSEQDYVLNVIDDWGCENSDTVTVCVNPLPEIEALSDTTIAQGEVATLTGNGGVSYIWSPSSLINCPDCPQIDVSPDSTTIYYVVGTDSNNCIGNDSVTVIVEYIDTVMVPNLFSPNGDGHNDILYVRTFGMFENIHFRLFNRWGKLVFETFDKDIGWDGYYNGSLQPVDVYVYYLVANTLDGETIQQKGDVTLLR